MALEHLNLVGTTIQTKKDTWRVITVDERIKDRVWMLVELQKREED